MGQMHRVAGSAQIPISFYGEDWVSILESTGGAKTIAISIPGVCEKNQCLGRSAMSAAFIRLEFYVYSPQESNPQPPVYVTARC
jgi:hypothetical protein